MITDADLTDDAVLDGRIRLYQPRVGYRAGMDAAILAAGVKIKPGGRLLDLGCGVGAALLAAAWRNPGVQCVGLERDPDMAALARRNVARNDLDARVQIVTGAVEDKSTLAALGPFDQVMCNPPYFDDPQAMRGPHPARAGAYMSDAGLPVWLHTIERALKPKGQMVVIQQSARLADILSGLKSCGSARVLPVHPFADEPAKRVMVAAVKGGRAPLQILPGMILHEKGRKHTEFVEGILRGEEYIPLFA